MKRTKVTPLLCLAALAAAVLVVCTGAAFSASADTALAESSFSATSFEFTDYGVEYDIEADRVLHVTEDMTVKYTGYRSTGFIKDIPVNGGELVRNVNVTETVNGNVIPAYFKVEIEDRDFISVVIGDDSIKRGSECIYTLTYDYCLTRAQEGAARLNLNAIGVARPSAIHGAKVTVTAPAGFIRATYTAGERGSGEETPVTGVTTEADGRKKFVLSGLELGEYEGVSLFMEFEPGTLKTYFEFTPYIYVIAAAALILATLAVKAAFFNRHRLIPVVNFEAPDGMDPLIMGKLIDNKVNAEDVTSLIYYWADKGYLAIDLNDKDDPVLIKLKNLPATAQNYEQAVFAGLFRTGEGKRVKTSELRYAFYRTFENATAMVNDKAKGLYSSGSIGVSVIFALLGGALAGLAPLLCALTAIHSSLLYFYGFIALLPALILYGLTETVMYNKFKNAGKKNVLFCALLALGIALCTLIFAFYTPDSVIPMLPKVLLFALCFTGVALSVLIVSRTQDYTEKLNGIIGFRNFILYAEKDRLERLLEEDPQYYYHVLPYAQVLNVSDKWEEKFKDITMAPPVWATCSDTEVLLNFTILNGAIRRSTTTIASGMISRPSSSGAGGAGGGFSFHISGGGHGGGGFRGK